MEAYFGGLPEGLTSGKIRSEPPEFTSEVKGPRGEPLLEIWRSLPGGYSCFAYCEGLTFAIDRDGRHVWAEWSGPVTTEDASAFFLGQILGFVLHLRGHICLHASAVAVECKAVLFAGEPGMGKSSTAAAFADRGCPILADDVSAVKRGPAGELLVMPGFPRVCLWPDSADFLYGPGSAGRYPRVQPAEEKLLVRLDTTEGKFRTEPAPLGAIYLLAPRTPDESAPRIESVETAQQLLGLIANGYVSLALGQEHREEEFRMLGEMGRTAPVRRLVPSNDPEKLGELCELVMNDLAAQTAPVAARAER